jgi:hypothetical protein
MARVAEKLLIAAVVVAAMVWAWREVQIHRLEVASGANSAAPVQEVVPVPADSTARVESVAVAPAAESNTVPTLVGKSIKVDGRLPDDFLARLSDPRRKSYVKAGLVAAMDSLYAPLFRCYQLTSDELSYLKYLIAEKKAVEEEYNVRLIAKDTAQTTVLQREAADAAVEWDAQVRDFLGAEAFDLYEGYNRSLPERLSIKDARTRLETTGAPLTYEQEDALIRLMYEERVQTPALKDFADSPDPALAMTRARENPEEIVAAYDAMVQRIGWRARDFLEPSQFTVVTNQLAGNRAALEGMLVILSTLTDEELAEAAVGGMR